MQMDVKFELKPKQRPRLAEEIATASPNISASATPGQRKISTPMCLRRHWRRLRTLSARH